MYLVLRRFIVVDAWQNGMRLCATRISFCYILSQRSRGWARPSHPASFLLRRSASTFKADPEAATALCGGGDRGALRSRLPCHTCRRDLRARVREFLKDLWAGSVASASVRPRTLGRHGHACGTPNRRRSTRIGERPPRNRMSAIAPQRAAAKLDGHQQRRWSAFRIRLFDDE